MTKIEPGTVSGGGTAASALEPKRPLTPAAERALAEAAERRAKADRDAKASPAETGGREGPDPVRYGDWENNGIISDF